MPETHPDEQAMTTPLKVLIVEDDERDATLLLRELRRGGYEPSAQRVETAETMREALDGGPWDIVLSDYSMPRFSAPEALAIVKETGLDLPFIIVSGTVGEETAVTAMRAGAHDFMAKDALARLLPAIERGLRDAAVRAERKRMQEQLLISERMASVGLLAASVAHEINNPLAVLLGNLEFVRHGLTQLAEQTAARAAVAGGSALDARLAADLRKIDEPLRDAHEAAERVRRIARDLKVFSRTADDERRGPVELDKVLESSIRMASNEIRHRATLVKDYREVPPVDANEARLGQVFLNLIVNGAQAIPQGRADANMITIATRLGEDGRVVVAISDTGVGIAPDLLKRIFDPFFTTKPSGVGTGLGLAICQRILEGMDGHISVDSTLGRGTTFSVSLPAVRATALPDVPADVGTSGDQRGRILVVDDEPLLCIVIDRILGSDHEVTVEPSAARALELIRGGARFDVILSDLMMPDMNGMDLYAELARSAPDQASRMIFMTGGAFSTEAADFLQKAANAVLEKPFKAANLRKAVQGLMR
jgi:signal transduction histidine kinase